jgi:anti-sigma regulatory factor (Ser/Thr protein kinase)
VTKEDPTVHDLPLRTSLVVSAERSSARTARVAVHDLCEHAALGRDTADVAALLVSELVTNAHQHAGGSAVVDAVVDGRALRVEVEDEDPRIPAPQALDLEAERGRGLMLVAALASRWGTALTGHGKSVWFELDRA